MYYVYAISVTLMIVTCICSYMWTCKLYVLLSMFLSLQLVPLYKYDFDYTALIVPLWSLHVYISDEVDKLFKWHLVGGKVTGLSYLKSFRVVYNYYDRFFVCKILQKFFSSVNQRSNMQLGRQKMYSVPLSWSKYLLMFEPSSFVSIQFESLIFPGAKTSIAPTDEKPHRWPFQSYAQIVCG